MENVIAIGFVFVVVLFLLVVVCFFVFFGGWGLFSRGSKSKLDQTFQTKTKQITTVLINASPPCDRQPQDCLSL